MKGEKKWLWLAWKMPRKLTYWCAIRVAAHATQGQWSNQIVPDLTALEALRRWDVAEKAFK